MNMAKAVIEQQDPHTDWATYKLTVKRKVATYEIARTKLVEYEQNTDVPTESDSTEKTGRGKRKKRRVILSSEDEDDDNWSGSQIRPTPPPTLSAPPPSTLRSVLTLPPPPSTLRSVLTLPPPPSTLRSVLTLPPPPSTLRSVQTPAPPPSTLSSLSLLTGCCEWLSRTSVIIKAALESQSEATQLV
ncbi:unnamed protein product [Leuciscus chuanchicus]